MAIKTAKELADACRDIALSYKTLYVYGGIGFPMTEASKSRCLKAYSYNRTNARKSVINAATPDVFGFDCVCLIKALLWGWNGDENAVYGGAKYLSNGVPDVDAGGMLRKCRSVSTDFRNIEVGELVWIPGHVGIYIGDNLVVECTPIWKDGVQITALHNRGTKAGYHGRTWTKHGKLPYVEYMPVAVTPPAVKPEASDTMGLNVGDVVTFTGSVHFKHSNATTGDICKPGKAKITSKSSGKHPYHLVRIVGGGSTVYGWVDAEDIAELQKPWVPEVGDTVKFVGITHYASADATTGAKCSGGEAKITAKSTGKHPYHLVRTGAKGPYGWVDAGTFTKA